MAILVPFSQSRQSETVLNRGVALARSYDTSLVVLLASNLTATSQDKLDSDNDRIAAELTKADIPFTIISRIDEADLAKKIIESAHDYDVELIIIALAPKPEHGTYLLGTQVQKLLVEAPCEVLIMRDEISS